MSQALSTEFHFGHTTVHIVQGDMLNLGKAIDILVSTDDNHLTMASGLARQLAEKAGEKYRFEAQSHSPVPAGTVVVTDPADLVNHVPGIKQILHGAVIDYDTYQFPLEKVVYQTTIGCLEQAEALEMRTIALPAFATGAGGLDIEACAHQMCSAIKTYLAIERSLLHIYVVLYLPIHLLNEAGHEVEEAEPIQRARESNERYITEANLVLDTPYNPEEGVRTIRDCFGRTNLIERLEMLILGGIPSKRHAAILGGSHTGKATVLDQLYYRSQQPDSLVGQKRTLIRVSFGRVLAGIPGSFIYRKLLLALCDIEGDSTYIGMIRRAYANNNMGYEQFKEFFETHAARYPNVVFLVDRLPAVLLMGAETFWQDIGELAQRVQIIYSATDDDQFRTMVAGFDPTLQNEIEEFNLAWVDEPTQQAWINDIYQHYLEREPTAEEYKFITDEAGHHPYLLQLICYNLIKAIKRSQFTNPNHPKHLDERTLRPFFREATRSFEKPRRRFFDQLMEACIDPRDQEHLKRLAQAIQLENRLKSLRMELASGQMQMFKEFQKIGKKLNEMQYRHLLELDRLARLAAEGYLIRAEDSQTTQLVSQSFLHYLTEFFGLNPDNGRTRPRNAVITLLRPEPQVIESLFRSDGARIMTARKPFLDEEKAQFLQSFNQYISHKLYPTHYPDIGGFESLAQIGEFIMRRFSNRAIMGYVQNPPSTNPATVLLVVDDDLKDIPWELMLETATTEGIPFRIGRSIVSQQQIAERRVEAQNTKIRALLIGDPTDDLPEARLEIEQLASLLREDGRFEVITCVGSDQCRWMPLWNQLSEGTYGLIHYAGHSFFDGYQSAWQLKDGTSLPTNMLTDALSSQPPALVFSSSCESAIGEEPKPLIYEDQTFDLPSAFLQAGVPAYVGTLWSVESNAARRFSEAFYTVLVEEGWALGECLRRAKLRLKQEHDEINWPSYVLYGEPGVDLDDLLPSLQQ